MSEFRRRLMAAAAQGGSAAYYDAEVEYLQSTGDQLINTGLILSENDTLVIDAQFLKGSGDRFLAHAISSGTGQTRLELYNNYSWYVAFGSPSPTSKNVAGVGNHRHIYTLSKGSFLVDGVHKLSPSFSSMPTDPLCLFARSSGAYYTIAKLWSAYVLDSNDNKRADWIPVRVGTEGCLYDKVGNRLLHNVTTTNFTIGNDITT